MAIRKAMVLYVFFIVAGTSVFAQQKKYPSLLWEITGNSLQKPSYLFGTMHVSSKMVFHLSDSFYSAIKNVDMVALEQNPLYWQRDMMRADHEEEKITSYMRNGANDYLNEKSFQLQSYDDNLRAALTDEPQVVNGLLYRSYNTQEDYEENTYLDLYIYQTGRKLGKKAAGVEDYFQTERIVFEAYQDALKDKNKRERNTNGESASDIEKKIQDAYRQGDLDMLDSLEKFEYASPAFLEKFLYKRSEIQANSIDTIVKHNSLFVGVGAAHLPGKRGVIELLRKKGYHLRPVFMQDRNDERKDEIDKMKVPLQFRSVSTDDGFISMQLPGPLYKRNTTGKGNESWQYADMENGTYYTIIRVKTESSLLGESLQETEKKTDSLLYENIPGKIIKKSIEQIDGYPVIDVTNRTRRGDLQRYNIIITPFEEIVCKMSGNENYVAGGEADTFFHSLHINYHPKQAVLYANSGAGFSAAFPQMPYSFVNVSNSDEIKKHEWELIDTITGNKYVVWKKTINNYRFLEEDTFDLNLIEESLKRSEIVGKEISRSLSKLNGFDALSMNFTLTNGNLLSAKAILRGPQYYLVMAICKKKNDAAIGFLNSFRLTDFVYTEAHRYQDTSLHFIVETPVSPMLDAFLFNMEKESVYDKSWQQYQSSGAYSTSHRTAFFHNDSTGEAVLVNCTIFPKYYYNKDSATFWKLIFSQSQFNKFIVKKKEVYKTGDSCSGYKIILQDTNTVRQITSIYLLKKNYLFHIVALSDTVEKQSSFIQSFLNTFHPDNTIEGESIFKDKQSVFFDDYNSKDSLVHAKANDALADVSFSCDAIPELTKAISSFKFNDKIYFENKSRFIKELGLIKDSSCKNEAAKMLTKLYRQTEDTALFQNEIILALARLTTQEAYDSLGTYLLQNPPIFDNDNTYDDLFELLHDSLQISRRLFPDLLQLSSIESYKKPVMDLLQTMVDSGLLTVVQYQTYFSPIYFDAKIELKKMQNDDERLLQHENDDIETQKTADQVYGFSFSTGDNNTNDISSYATLLMPFYTTKNAIPVYFSKLLASKNASVQLDAAITLTKYKIKVADSIWNHLVTNDKYRIIVLKRLKEIKREDLFPPKYNTQEAIAKSILLNSKGEDQFQSIELLNRQFVTTSKGSGYVYFFKYKLNKDSDWKIGIGGLQPKNLKETNDNSQLTAMTEKSIDTNKQVLPQFNSELKEILFSLHESAYRFFVNNQYNSYHQTFSFGN